MKNLFKNNFFGKWIHNVVCAFIFFVVTMSIPGYAQSYVKLFNAARRGNTTLVKELIAQGVDVNAKVNGGFTALMVASLKGDTEVVKLLINAKADVNAKDNSGFTALMYAIQKGRTEVVKLLIDAKADLNAKTSSGGTALMYASQMGHIDIVKLLIDAKADLNAQDKNGQTALIYAAGSRKPQAVKLLLDAGADINIKTKPGTTVLDFGMDDQSRALITEKAKAVNGTAATKGPSSRDEIAAREKKFLESLKGVEKAAAEVIIRNLEKSRNITENSVVGGASSLAQSEFVDIFLSENKQTGYHEGYYTMKHSGGVADLQQKLLAAFGGQAAADLAKEQKIEIRVRYNGRRCMVEAFNIDGNGMNVTYY